MTTPETLTCVFRNGQYIAIETLDKLRVNETAYTGQFTRTVQYANRLVEGGPTVLMPVGGLDTVQVKDQQVNAHKLGCKKLAQPYSAQATDRPVLTDSRSRMGMMGDRYGWLRGAQTGCMVLSRMGGDFRFAADVGAAVEKALADQTLRGFTAAFSDALVALMKMPENHVVQNAIGMYLGNCMQLTLQDLQKAGVGFVSILEDGTTLWEHN